MDSLVQDRDQWQARVTTVNVKVFLDWLTAVRFSRRTLLYANSFLPHQLSSVPCVSHVISPACSSLLIPTNICRSASSKASYIVVSSRMNVECLIRVVYFEL
jgi:hypothetical protein